MLPPTVVSCIGKRHSYETALAYQEVGALLRFVTGVHLSEKTAGRLGALGKRLRKRVDPRLDASRVVSMPLVELLGDVGARILGERAGYQASELSAELFDRRCAQLLEGAQAVHGFEYTASATFEAAKKRGMRTILDAPTVHHATWSRILEEEILPIAPSVGRMYLKRIERTKRKKNEEVALADRILVPSRWCASSYESQITSSDSIAIASYGAKVRDGDAARPREKARFLCLTSGLGLLKGTHHLLAAFAPLSDEAELWLAGPVHPELRLHLAKHGRSVRLFGKVGPAQIQKLFDESNVFVFPSLCESSSLAVLEAMGQGLPVVVTERCGSPVEDGVQGIVVSANQTEPITEALGRLRDPDLRAAMGAKAKARAQERTWAAYREAVRQAVAVPEIPRSHLAASA